MVLPLVGLHLLFVSGVDFCINCVMIRVMVTGHLQADGTKPSTVDLSSKEVVTLGGDQSPSPSHLPGPLALCLCLAVLFELVGHVNKAHDVAHVLSNQLITLVPGGRKFDIQISKQYGDMPLSAFIPCSLDVCQYHQIIGGI